MIHPVFKPIVFRKALDFGGDSYLPNSLPSPAQVLRACLCKWGLVSFPYGGVYNNPNLPYCSVSSMPDDPDAVVMIEDKTGRMFGRGARTGQQTIHYGVVVKVRTLDYTGWSLALQIATAIDTLSFPVYPQLPEDGSVHYVDNIIRSSQIIAMGEEPNKKRQVWIINARIACSNIEPTLG